MSVWLQYPSAVKLNAKTTFRIDLSRWWQLKNFLRRLIEYDGGQGYNVQGTTPRRMPCLHPATFWRDSPLSIDE
jgi:hypothetical protein